MNSTTATAEVFITAFRSLKKREQEAVKEILLSDKEFLEDVRDVMLIRQRKNEPRRSFRTILKEVQTKK